MSPPLPSCGGLIPSEPQDCLGEGGQEDALREAKDLLREKTFQREETLCVGAAAGRAAQPARVPLGPRRLSGWKAPGTFFADI